jgi:hypothetical protein
MVKTAAEINVHSNESVKTGVTPVVLAVTALTYSHVVFHNEKTGYVKLSFV